MGSADLLNGSTEAFSQPEGTLWLDTIFQFFAWRSGANDSDSMVVNKLPDGPNGARLTELVQQALKSAHGLISVGCNTGPGPFTAIKNGLATAQATALVLESEGRLAGLHGCSSLELLAQAAYRLSDAKNTTFITLRDARRGRFYARVFFAGIARQEAVDIGPEDPVLQSDFLYCWSNDRAARQMFPSIITLDERQLATVAMELLMQRCPPENLVTAEYVRPPDIDPNRDWRARLLGWQPDPTIRESGNAPL